MKKSLIVCFCLVASIVIPKHLYAQTFETLIPASDIPQFSQKTGEKLKYSNWSEQGIHSYGGIGSQISNDSIVIIAHKYCSAIGQEITSQTTKDFILLNSKGELIKRFVFDNRAEQPNWGGNLHRKGILEAIKTHTDRKHFYNNFEIWDYETSPFTVGEYGVSHRYSFSEIWEPGIIKLNPDFNKKLLQIESLRVARTPSNGVILIIQSKEKLWCFHIDSSNQLVSKKKIKTKFGKEIIELSEVVALDDTTFAIGVDWESKKENKNTLVIAKTSGKVLSHNDRKSGASEEYPSHQTESLLRMHDGSLLEFYSNQYFEPAKELPKVNPQYADYFKDWVQIKSINLNASLYESDGNLRWQMEDIETLEPRQNENFVSACQLSNGNIAVLHNFKSSSTPPKFILLDQNGKTIKKSQVGTLRSYKHRLSPTLDGGALAVGIYLDDPDSSTIHVMKFDSLGNIDNVVIDSKILLTNANNILKSDSNLAGDSLRNALRLYSQTLKKEPHNKDALWGAANILEYTGLYTEAAGLYRTLAGLNGLSSSYKKEVLAHAITSEYLAGKKKKSKPKTIQKQVKELAKVIDTAQFTKQGIKKRTKWPLLKELAATVVTIAGVGLNGADDATIRKSLSLLDGWMDAPAGQEIEARNRYLSGMLAEITTLIIRNKLGLKVGNALDRTGRESLELPPEELSRTKTQGREDFKSLEAPPKQQTTKKVAISDDFSVSFSGESSSEGISGLYKCIDFDDGGRSKAILLEQKQLMSEQGLDFNVSEDDWTGCIEPGTYTDNRVVPAKKQANMYDNGNSQYTIKNVRTIHPIEVTIENNTITIRYVMIYEFDEAPYTIVVGNTRRQMPRLHITEKFISEFRGTIKGDYFQFKGTSKTEVVSIDSNPESSENCESIRGTGKILNSGEIELSVEAICHTQKNTYKQVLAPL